nr:MAG: hypothetical protein [Microvirus sp.]
MLSILLTPKKDQIVKRSKLSHSRSKKGFSSKAKPHPRNRPSISRGGIRF